MRKKRHSVPSGKFQFIALALLFSVSIFSNLVQAQSNWIKIGTNGKLVYTPDSKGNTIPDFSYCGYRNSESAIPNIPVVKTITALSGDNLSSIQNAINEVSNLAPDANGYRGAILLKAGEYKVSNVLRISKSGVVLRGEGNSTTGTRLIATRTAQHDFILIAGTGGPSEVSNTRVKISDAYVPIGTRSFNVANAAAYKAGDKIAVLFVPKQNWIDMLSMAPYGWTPSGYNLRHYRKVVAVSGNKITIDAPIVNPIDANYADGYVYKTAWTGKIEDVGIENMRITSVYASVDDENHGWKAVTFNNLENAWAKDIIAVNFGYACVSVLDNGHKISVLNCQMLDPMSQTTGGRKYSFDINGQLVLVRGCYTRGGRHDFVTGAQTNGPNAFVSCKSDGQRADNGPHHRWANGLLYDNIVGNGDLNVQNRKASGSGHGWAGAQTVLWNCTGRKFIVQSPPQHYNWAIGCKGTVTDDGNWHDGNPGVWESTGTFVAPQSLFDKQLQDRITVKNENPIVNITTPSNNATFTAPASINITANASDDGAVTKVEFFSGSTLLGSDNTSPYAFAWSNVVAGTYAITAKATDDKGASTTSAAITLVVNATCTPTPIVTNVQVNGGAWTNTTTATLNAGGTLKFGPQPATGGSWSWTGPNGFLATTREVTLNNIQTNQAGNYVTTYTNAGGCKSTATFSVTVRAVNTNTPPTCAITSPANNANFTAPASVSIAATASDADGTVSKVEFYQGSTKLGEDASSPYNLTWTNVAAGTYSLTVRATDNSGAVTTSSAISVTVKVSTDVCAAIATYQENAGYVAGSKVKNVGKQYECKEYPYSGWCNGAAWAYAPGTGSYWQDAWYERGTCLARIASNEVMEIGGLNVHPNPASTHLELRWDNPGNESAAIEIADVLGTIVMHTRTIKSGDVLSLSELPAGSYQLKVSVGNSVMWKRIVKQ